VKRRAFITLLGGAAAAWPLVARAQQPRKVWRIGFAGASRPASLEVSQFGGFQQGMREHGYVEGKDFVMEWRFADANPERYLEFAAEFVQLKVDVIVLGTPAALRAVQQATSTIPIVMGYSVDPVGNGFVASLARPGGNITGLSSSQDDATPKQVEKTITRISGINPGRVRTRREPTLPELCRMLVVMFERECDFFHFLSISFHVRCSHAKVGACSSEHL
jgi:putative ABC transport system substrate-binding protein